jgi:hypothetical protein
MADKRISQLIERVDIANNDVLPIVASGATTTNKVTISTLQDWMQENIDLGVTSVGITLGTTGTDVNVTGSPITSSGNITINIPTASATNRGLLSAADWSTFNGKQAAGNYVTTDTTQTITGEKTFTNSILLKNSPSLDGLILQSFSPNALEIGHTSAGSTYYSSIVFPAGAQSWNLPNSSGTIALTSDLAGYVTLGTAQTITAQKTFSTSGSSDTAVINHGSGSGIALNITKAGNGEGLRVAKTSGSGNAVTITGGTLSAEAGQFSGDLQSTSRVIASASSQSILLHPNNAGTTNRIESVGTLPLALVSAAAITMAAGGTTPQITLATTGAVTLTGNLNITKTNSLATFILKNTSSTTGLWMYLNGLDGYISNQDNGPLILQTNGTDRLTLASTGAATFSSSVTATSGTFSGSSVFPGQFISSAGETILRLQNTATNGRDWFIIAGGNSGSFNTGQFGIYDNTAGLARFAITSSGNVGIGTASPSSTLEVRGTFRNALSSGAGGQTLLSPIVGVSNGYLISVDTSNNISHTWHTGANAVSMAITSTGNVGIGTASPGTYDSAKIGTSHRFLNVQSSSSAYSVATLAGNQSSADSRIGYLTFVNDNNSSSYKYSAWLGSEVEGSTANQQGGRLIFSTSGDASSAGPTERMRITSGGFTKARANGGGYFNGSYHELINNNNVSGDRCLVIGNNGGSNTNNTSSFTFVVADQGNDRLIIYGNGNVVNQNNSYGSLSDIKLKENIEDASPKLIDLLKVKVRNYNLIGDDKKQIGVIAQELEEVFPAMVDESEDFEDVEVPQLDEEGNEVLNEEGEVVTTTQRVSKGTTTKSVKYSVFVPMLIKAIQELKAEIDSLKTK